MVASGSTLAMWVSGMRMDRSASSAAPRTSSSSTAANTLRTCPRLLELFLPVVIRLTPTSSRPERLETIFAGCKYVGNIFIYGDSTKSFIVAVVVPEPIAARHWATEQGLKVTCSASSSPERPRV